MILNKTVPDFIRSYTQVLTGPEHSPSLCCPRCACENVHLTNVFVGMGHTCVLASGDDATTIRSTKCSDRSGSRIVITFAAECLHGFSYAYEFRKGQTVTQLLNVHDIEPDRFPSCLWRA